MRAFVFVLALLAPTWAGCASPAQEEATLVGILALDGRWPFSVEHASSLSRAAGFEPLGALVFAEARVAGRVVDVVGLDAGAAAALGEPLPSASAAHASASVVGPGLATLSSQSAPLPYVANYFEMDRTRSCESNPGAKLCFLPPEVADEARLRLRVGAFARDGGFLPDLVELSATARPAWWNGSFTSPSGTSTPFQAVAPSEGALVPAFFDGPMEAGDWVIRFRLETPLGVAQAGAAGIVRVREPGFFWFDDRILDVPDARAQSRSVMDTLQATRVDVEVTQRLSGPVLGASVVLALEDARALAGLASGEASALLVRYAPAAKAAFEASRESREGFDAALRVRSLPDSRTTPEGDALVFAAPPGLRLEDLPRIVGVTPSLALAGRAPLGEPGRVEGREVGDVTLLSLAEGPAPWSVPEGGKWPSPESALDNLSRARTLALASRDVGVAPTAAERFQTGDGASERTLVLAGSVDGGPTRSLWTSAAFIAGQGRPVSPRIVVPLREGSDPDVIREQVLSRWGAFGVVADLAHG